VTPGPAEPGPLAGQKVQTVTLRNQSSGDILGPVSLVLNGLSLNATLKNKSGTLLGSASTPYLNARLPSAYLKLTDFNRNVLQLRAGVFRPAETVTVQLIFDTTDGNPITYTPTVLSGDGTR